jgi:phosphoribosylformylglycinamidine synthase
VNFAVLVEVSLRPGIANPEGATIERSLPALGFTQVSGVRTGKAIRFSISAGDEAVARAQVEELCRRFLTNPVIEVAHVTLSVAPGAGAGAGAGSDSGSGSGSGDGAGDGSGDEGQVPA